MWRFASASINDYVATTLAGMSSTRQVEENVNAYAFVAAPGIMAQIRKIVESVTNLTWPSGRKVNTP